MRGFRRCIICLTLSGILFFGSIPRVEAGPAREILLTSTYGVLAGAIVGLASIAFYSSPASHLQNVAIGASIGLYMGIALGAYVAYGITLDDGKEEPASPEEEKKEEEKTDSELPQEPPKDSPDIQGSQSSPHLKLAGNIELHMPSLALGLGSQGKGIAGYAQIIRMEF